MKATAERKEKSMTERELKRLRRSDLLEILLDVSRENEQLKQALSDARSQLADRTIRMESAGSIAEAALQLNGVFEATQNACEQYLENIRQKSRQADELQGELMLRLLNHCGDCRRWQKLFPPKEKAHEKEEKT